VGNTTTFVDAVSVPAGQPVRRRLPDERKGTRFVNKYSIFVLEVLKAWTDPAQKDPKTTHHHGYGRFAVDGKMIKLTSRMR
jgi:hypothetical protein